MQEDTLYLPSFKYSTLRHGQPFPVYILTQRPRGESALATAAMACRMAVARRTILPCPPPPHLAVAHVARQSRLACACTTVSAKLVGEATPMLRWHRSTVSVIRKLGSSQLRDARELRPMLASHNWDLRESWYHSLRNTNAKTPSYVVPVITVRSTDLESRPSMLPP